MWNPFKRLEKLNPAQPNISLDEGEDIQSQEVVVNYYAAYAQLEVVRNGVDKIVNGLAQFDFDIKDSINIIPRCKTKPRKAKLDSLLNYQPNPYQDCNSFRRSAYMDFLIDGNIFFYWDGAYLYNLPANKVTIQTDPVTFVKGYLYEGMTEAFPPSSVIHIRDNSAKSIYRGDSRLASAQQSINTLYKMKNFQLNYFDNSAIPGLVITTPNVLGEKIKERLLLSWMQKYNPTKGGKRPLILDGGLDVKAIAGGVNFTELDYDNSITSKEEKVLMALGVPSILINGGNNANISPNLRLFYLETVYPIAQMITSALENFFGYDISAEIGKVSALQPDMRESGAYYVGLVNGGIISPNEARGELRFEPKPDSDDLRIPANIAGSAANPNEGGAPKKEGSND